MLKIILAFLCPVTVSCELLALNLMDHLAYANDSRLYSVYCSVQPYRQSVTKWHYCNKCCQFKLLSKDISSLYFDVERQIFRNA